MAVNGPPFRATITQKPESREPERHSINTTKKGKMLTFSKTIQQPTRLMIKIPDESLTSTACFFDIVVKRYANAGASAIGFHRQIYTFVA
jgi:hypothetical protein